MRITPTLLEEYLRTFYLAFLVVLLLMLPAILFMSPSGHLFAPNIREVLIGILMLAILSIPSALASRRWDCQDLVIDQGQLFANGKRIDPASISRICKGKPKPKRDVYFAMHLSSGETIHFKDRLSLSDYNPVKCLINAMTPFTSFTFRELDRLGLSSKFSRESDRA